MAHRRCLGSLLILVFFLLPFSFCLCPPALASPTPPPTGDWTIEVGEEVTVENQDLSLPGCIIINGHLTLTNCTLYFTPSTAEDRGLTSYGQFDATDTTFASTNEWPVFFKALGSSANQLARCTFEPGYLDLYGDSTNGLTDCQVNQYRLSSPYCEFRGSSHNTFGGTTFTGLTRFNDATVNTATDCLFGGEGSGGTIDTYASTVNSFTRCTFTGYPFFYSPSSVLLDHCAVMSCGVPAQVVFRVDDITIAHLTDLTPGDHVTALVQGENTSYRVEIIDSAIGSFAVDAMARATLVVENCDLASYSASGYSQTDFINSRMCNFYVCTQRGGWGEPDIHPTNVHIVGLRDDDTPLDTEITSDNSPFRVRFQNTSIYGRLTGVSGVGLYLGSSGTALPAYITVEDSLLIDARCQDNTVTTLRNSTVNRAIVYSCCPERYGGSAQIIAEDSRVQEVYLHGLSTSVTLRRTPVMYNIEFCYISPDGAPWIPGSHPALVLDDAILEDSHWLNWVDVDAGVTGATISGTADISPAWYVRDWGFDSEITRSYPVLVKGPDHLPVPGAQVRVTDPYGETTWSGATNTEGYAFPEVLFTAETYQSEFSITAFSGGAADSVTVACLTSTPLTLYPGLHGVSSTSFETQRSPWTTFAAGSGQAAAWRQVERAASWRPGVIAPSAHSGEMMMDVDVVGNGLAGLRLDLPFTPTTPAGCALRTWAYFGERTEGNASSFVGFAMGDGYPSPGAGWSSVLGVEVLSATQSLLHLSGSTVSLPYGIAAGGWHLVEVTYNRQTDTLSVALDGVTVAEETAGAGGAAPVRALMGALGTSSAARQNVYFDDTSLRLEGNLPAPPPEHMYARLEGPERVMLEQTAAYHLYYGNGWPVLGVLPSPGDDTDQPLYLGLSLPVGYSFVSSDPAPARVVAGQPVWEVGLPHLGEENSVALTLQAPTVGSGFAGQLHAWASLDSGGGAYNPPAPPHPLSPPEPDWGAPYDLLPQVLTAPEALLPDLWVDKRGPETVRPNRQISYLITVGNRGLATATNVVVKDLMPEALGGAERIVANLAELAPGEVWRGLVTATVPWTTPAGTVLLNRAYIPTGTPEAYYPDNVSEWVTTVEEAEDPNRISVSPEGGVNAGDTLTYTLECENMGTGTAYGVYATATLDPLLDETTLELPSGMSYDPDSRELTWIVGMLYPGSENGASTTFQVQVGSWAKRGRSISEQAVIYFPSAGEETPTNIAVSVLNGSFSDVPWNHWALLPIEQAYENGIVGGYGDGTYRPAVSIDRGQMAVFISRALAGGDSHVPTGPPTATFSDVPTSFWAFKYVEYARAHGVVGGYSDGTYRPTVLVDRGQMAVFVARAVAGGDGAVPDPPATPTFPDVTPSTAWAWAQKYVEYIASRSVVGGYGDGTYRPDTICTRDQMAVFVARAFELPM